MRIKSITQLSDNELHKIKTIMQESRCPNESLRATFPHGYNHIDRAGGIIMKKLFISQPMKDKTNEEILAVRAKAIESAKRHLGEDVEVIDSFFKDAPHEAKPLWFLGKSFELLSTADVAYFAKGWDQYRGCKMENMAALEYGIDTIIEDYSD